MIESRVRALARSFKSDVWGDAAKPLSGRPALSASGRHPRLRAPRGLIRLAPALVIAALILGSLPASVAAATSQTITFTSGTTAVVGGTYTATATGGGSGNPVTFTIDGMSTAGCSITSGSVSFTAVGHCIIDANQAGNAYFDAAPQVQQTVTVSAGTQATLTITGPATKTYGNSPFAPTTSGGSGTGAITFTSSTSSFCTATSSATVTIVAAGACIVTATKAADTNYSATTSAAFTVTVAIGSQAITWTSTAPTAAQVGGTYTPTATGGASGNTVTFSIDAMTASGVCSGTSPISFDGPGTCIIDANQAGTATHYSAAPQVQQTIVVGGQTIVFTSTAPTAANAGGATYTPTAIATSFLPVTLKIDSSSSAVCSMTAGVVSFTWSCICFIDSNQSGNASYLAAPQVQQTFAVGSQTITFASTAPTAAVVGGATYTPIAIATSGLTVAITIDSSSSAVCSISGGVVSFTAAGTCIIDANQAGDANYGAAPQVQQTFSVGATSQTITFTSTAPTAAVVGGATYTPAATATSGLTVTFTIDSSSSAVCSITGGVVSFTAAGTCTIDADQAGNASFSAATQVQQSFVVATAPGVATHLTVSIAANPTIAGAAHSVTVTVLDANGNIATGYSGTIHFNASEPAATVPANYTFTAADAGVHTFSYLLSPVVFRTAGTQALRARDTMTGTITGVQTGIVVQ